MITYNTGKDFNNDLCKDFGIDRIEDDTESVVMAFTVVALVCFVLFIMSVWYIYKQNVNNLNWITPSVIGVIGLTTALLAFVIGSKDNTTGDDNSNIDSKIRDWCYKTNDTGKALNVTMAVFLGISIAVFVGWLTSMIANSCEIY